MTIYEFAEYQTKRLDWPDPSPADRRLADALEQNGRRVRIRWLADGQAEFRTYSWIGVVQFDHCRVHIVPKAAGGSLGVLHMLDYASGLDALHHLEFERHLATGGEHLRDLVCQLVTTTSDKILHQGPARDYVTREQALPHVRGRLLADRQILRRYGRLDQLECRFDDFDTDTLDNQILAAGAILAARTATAATVRAFARRVAADYAALCDPTHLDPGEAAARLTYTRRNENYRSAHFWSLLLLRESAIHDLYQDARGRANVFLLDMNRLFEDFITRLVTNAMGGSDVRVQRQARNRSVLIDEATGRPYGTVIPDILITRGAGAATWQRAIDVKYKLYDGRLDPADIYQSFLYAQALSRPGLDPDLPTTILIHPGTAGIENRILVRAHVRNAARVRTLALDIPDTLTAVASRPGLRTFHDRIRRELTR